ncbi:hypothetical protein VSU01S_25750 [Vibrio superstes NBRC 103154]|uniref:Uncharacterized protein n=1 Tax=Vibrio superstes NBRC 103154 TaxID=1219062 RepID=A0A511QSL4_9VIBR|nr:hypothetical protein VSU01S_25750 [Vibrio superstes NBRC 103154]
MFSPPLRSTETRSTSAPINLRKIDTRLQLGVAADSYNFIPHFLIRNNNLVSLANNLAHAHRFAYCCHTTDIRQRTQPTMPANNYNYYIQDIETR